MASSVYSIADAVAAALFDVFQVVKKKIEEYIYGNIRVVSGA